MTTPVLRVREGLLVVMLSGSIDFPRARQLAEQLLRRIRDERARIVVLDLTGVSDLEPSVADHLIGTAEALRFIGAEVLVTGLSSPLAQALAAAKVDLNRVSLYGDLQSAIEYAQTRLNRVTSGTGMRSRRRRRT